MVQIFVRCLIVTFVCAHLGARMIGVGEAADRPLTIVALGDSLTAGYELPAEAAFPARLARALIAQTPAVQVLNAGVSGDTAAQGLARLDWSVPGGTDAVIVELGANDALRGIDPERTQAALDAILRRLRDRGILILLAGMRAPANLGPEYAHSFETIFPNLAARFGAILYPFFLDGVAGNPGLTLPDGLHPNAAGVERIVTGILPKVEELVSRVKAQRTQ
jgi:acyl-CoA thioesterase-1